MACELRHKKEMIAMKNNLADDQLKDSEQQQTVKENIDHLLDSIETEFHRPVGYWSTGGISFRRYGS